MGIQPSVHSCETRLAVGVLSRFGEEEIFHGLYQSLVRAVPYLLVIYSQTPLVAALLTLNRVPGSAKSLLSCTLHCFVE